MFKLKNVQKKCSQWRGVSVRSNVLAPLTIGTQIQRERVDAISQNINFEKSPTEMAAIESDSTLSPSSPSKSPIIDAHAIPSNEYSHLIASPEIPEKFKQLFEDNVVVAVNDEQNLAESFVSNDEPLHDESQMNH